MRPDTNHEESIKLYLLGGSLSEDQEAWVEDRLFADDEFLESLNMLEEEIIECFLCGELSVEERDLLHAHLSVCPRLLRKLEWSRAFLSSGARPSHLDQRVPGAPQMPTSWWGMVARSSRIAGRRARVASIVFLTAGALVASFWGFQQRGINRRLQAEISAQHAQTSQIAAQLQTEEQQRSLLEEQVAKLRQGRHALTISTVLVAAEIIGQGYRNNGQVQKIEISMDADFLLLRLPVKRDVYASYRGLIETVEGQELLSQSLLKTDGHHAVLWKISAAALNDNDYILTLFGTSRARPSKAVGSYYFRIRKEASQPMR